MPDLTPHLGAIVGDLADRLTLAHIVIRSVTLSPQYPGHEVRLFADIDGHRLDSITDACRVLEALASSEITIGRPYGQPDGLQVNVDGVVELAGQTVTVGIIADAAPAPEPAPVES